jgi:hypothetical protein
MEQKTKKLRCKDCRKWFVSHQVEDPGGRIYWMPYCLPCRKNYGLLRADYNKKMDLAQEALKGKPWERVNGTTYPDVPRSFEQEADEEEVSGESEFEL